MSPNEVALRELVGRIAASRVAGEKWQAIADSLGKAMGTVESYPRRYPAIWKAAYAKAEKAILKEARSEALHTLRKLLRSDSEAVQQQAAQKLLLVAEAKAQAKLAAAAPRSGSPIAEVRELVEFLEGMDHDRFREFFGEPAEAPEHDSPLSALAQ